MKRLSYFFVLVINPTFLFAQKLSDTSELLGVTTSYSKLYTTPIVKPENELEELKPGQRIAIYALTRSDRWDWYQIVYKKNKLFIREYAVTVNPNVLEFLRQKGEDGIEIRIRKAYRTDSMIGIIEQLEARKQFIVDSLTEVRKNNAVAKAKALGLLVNSFDFIENEYNQISFQVDITNYSKKAIKYVWFTVVALNRVKDVIGKSTVKLIGPIEFNDSGSAEFEDVFFTKVFYSGRMQSIKIQYMDGSMKELSGNNLRSILY